jgi:outer membrane protein insertion porin family
MALVALSTLRVAPLLGQDEPLSVTVDSIVVRGHSRYSAEGIQRLAQIRVGEVVNGPDIQEAIQRLFSTGEFSDVQIRVTPYTPAIFFIDVVERPVVGRYSFEGLKHASHSTITDSVGLIGGGPLDPSKLIRAQAMILKLLGQEGFPRATVDTALAPDPSGLDQLDVTFRVNEGPRLALAKVEISGNEALTDAQIRSSMSTVEEGFFWFKPGELHRDEYRTDLTERIPAYYGKHGYIDLEIVGDTIIVDTLTGKGIIQIRVREGEQYLVRLFEIEGNRRFPTSQLEEYYPPVRDGKLAPERLESGDLPPFDETAFEQATMDIADLYRDAGYLQVRVMPEVVRNPPDSAGMNPTVDVRLRIQEFNPAYIRTVSIVGNDYTHDRVIRKILLTLPGDIYSQKRLIQSVRNIQSLGFFETLPPDEAIQITPRDDGDIDIVFRVKERQTGNVNFGMSAAAVTGLAGFIGYDQPNLFGQAKIGHFRWLFGARTQDIEISYTDPELFGSRYSATLGLQSSRDRFQTFDLGTRRKTGGFFELGIPLFPLQVRSTRLFVGYSLFRESVSDLDAFGLGPDSEGLITQGTRSTVSVRLVRDTRVGGLFPTGGNRNQVAFRKTGGFLGGDGDYNTWLFDSEWFSRIAQIGGGPGSVPIEIVASLNFKAGLVFGDNPFFVERYFVGGTQVGQRVRGYEEATITPLGHVPRNAPVNSLARVGESYFTTSATFGIKLTDNIFASTFVDAGNLWSSAAEFNPTDLLVGAGVGVSLVTPFGPVGLDYAYGFDRRDVLGRPDPGWQLHFRFGQLF